MNFDDLQVRLQCLEVAIRLPTTSSAELIKVAQEVYDFAIATGEHAPVKAVKAA